MLQQFCTLIDEFALTGVMETIRQIFRSLFNVNKTSKLKMSRFSKVFQSTKCAILGMIHVRALPGSPRSQLSVSQLVDYACKEAAIYQKCNVDGVIIENMFDVPYVMGDQVGPEVTAVMTRIGSEVKKTIGKMPCGVQVLSGNNFSATAVALAADLQFVRAESFVFAHVADEGLMQACAGPLLRYSKNIGATDILYFTDIKKKHSSHAITSDVSLTQMAKDAAFFLSDGIIVTGTETGIAPNTKDFKDVKEISDLPVLIGSGVTASNVKNFFDADALIIGSHFKANGHWRGDLDSSRILKFMDEVQKLR
ncbi:uncharacterized protein F13E9.13, mitochondrial [Caerostris darwini]|uniref:Uncharacterized protein F13E9.13, mitochondrial n=1 Tax=Caerostris darwini TaxID=1538125 RepID=A0AAV4TC35_9ARAC|nr:uncharacterized protein F13E9.13, mitochondrial [Caerostris darwini]